MSLTQAARVGTFWTALSSIVGIAIQFGQLAVLARLLAPEDFGLAAMAMLVIGLLHVYADAGVGAAIIYRQDATAQTLASLYWLNIAVGLVLYGLVVAAAPAVVYFFDEPRLASLLPLAALGLLAIPFGQQFQTLLHKELLFRSLALLEIFSSLAGAGTAIWLAAHDFGVLALIYGMLTGTLARAALLVAIGLQRWRPALHFDPKDLRGYVNFGLYQLGERSINFFIQRTDQMILGALLGAEALGYYNLAFGLIMFPVTSISPVLTRVAFPIFARVQNDNTRLRRGYMLLQRFIAVINFPILAGMAVTAPYFVPIVFGTQWTPAIALLQILAFVGMFRASGNPVGALLLAKGRAKLGFWWTFSVILLQTPLVILGTEAHGAAGAALAILAAQLVTFWANYYVNIRSTIGPCLGAHLASFTPAAVSAGLMGTIVLAVSQLFDTVSLVSLITLVAVGVIVYAACNLLLFRKSSREVADFALGANR